MTDTSTKAQGSRTPPSTEERFSLALRAAKAGAWEWDIATNETRWSDENYRVMGLEPGSGIASYDAWLECVHPDDRAFAEERVAEALENRSDLDFEYRAVWPDGGVHWIRDVGSVLVDDDGAPLGMYGIQLDVTDAHELEEGLRRSQQVESLGRVAGALAHDFNNLLTVILSYCELLDDALGDATAARPMVGEIVSATQRAAHLTHQLLAVGRRQILRPRVVDLDPLVQALEGLIRSTLGESISFTARLSPEPLRAEADPGQIEQVMLNLVVNAKDAMPSGGRLTIETSEVLVEQPQSPKLGNLAPGRYVTLAIEDTGHGMDRRTLARIFEPFFTTKPSDKGSGLGLASAYGIVKQSGGHIDVTSEPGRGSRFTIYLRQVDSEPDTAETPGTIERDQSVRGRETVLVVEDEPSIRRLVVTSLRELGYTVFSASNSEDALDQLGDRLSGTDLLLTDIVLPGWSGPELASHLKRHNPGLKTLFMSGYSEEAIEGHGLLADRTAILSKPFSPSDLAEAIRRTLDSVG